MSRPPCCSTFESIRCQLRIFIVESHADGLTTLYFPSDNHSQGPAYLNRHEDVVDTAHQTKTSTTSQPKEPLQSQSREQTYTATAATNGTSLDSRSIPIVRQTANPFLAAAPTCKTAASRTTIGILTILLCFASVVRNALVPIFLLSVQVPYANTCANTQVEPE